MRLEKQVHTKHSNFFLGIVQPFPESLHREKRTDADTKLGSQDNDDDGGKQEDRQEGDAQGQPTQPRLACH